MKHSKLKRINWAILVTLSLLGVSLGAILLALFGPLISPYIAPRPDELFWELFASFAVFADWTKAVLWTAFMSLVAALLSIALGIAVGFAAAFMRLWSIDKWAQLIWSIPLIAIATYLLLAVGHGWAYGLSLGV